MQNLGHKCTLAMSQVTYLGHKFTQSGLTPDRSKIQAVQDWPTPANVSQFLGLASCYRRYISKFSTIAAPLTQLTQNRVVFSWSAECESSFQLLKSALTQAPILAYPDLNQNSSPFVLQTDASTFGLGAVLEQDGPVIAYASRTLTKCEQNYSVIQKECLAIVYALKQFRHYILGRKFLLLTDHAPLQWLGSQKMEGMLCHWKLSIQEFNFDTAYRKGSLNTNAHHALSRRDQPHCSEVTALTVSVESPKQLAQCQEADEVTKKLYDALLSSSSITSGKLWQHCPFHCYKQIWSQLKFVDGVLCRCYLPGPTSNTVTVSILPKGLHVAALHHCHNHPSGGHLGYEKTLHKLQREAYWVYMSRDVEQYCRQCDKCNASKPPAPQHAPMASVLIGKPWQMEAADVLEVPVSSNRYLLVVQDYFTKWVEVVPMPDQTATGIVSAHTKIFCILGIPEVLHSDQG